MAVQADVGSESDVTRLFETAERELGRISALVNNAARLESQMRLAAGIRPRIPAAAVGSLVSVHNDVMSIRRCSLLAREDTDAARRVAFSSASRASCLGSADASCDHAAKTIRAIIPRRLSTTAAPRRSSGRTQSIAPYARWHEQ